MDTETYSKRWLITITIMLVTVLEVLDMTIVNVSLPNMMSSLGGNNDSITWVLTSYIVSAAIFMPLTGFLVKRFGRKRLLLINITGFLITSLLCGASLNLAEMVLFRTLQGMFGASLIPLSQFILRDTFPHEEQGKAMAIWGIGIMAGPILGPTLGGYITEMLNWRWIFYINIPACLISWFLTLKLIKETPTEKFYIDWLGMFLLGLGIGSFQLFLDRGNTEDWFESATITLFAITSVISLFYFIIRGWNKTNHIINLHLFKDRNFANACLMLLLYGIAVFSTISLNPMMLEKLLNYPTLDSGLAMAPRGIASAFAMLLVSKLINKIEPRKIIFIGLLFCTFGTYLMTQFNTLMNPQVFTTAAIIQGFGMGFFFVPLSIIALSSLPKQSTAEASGLFSFSRSIGSSIGISIMSIIVTRKTQMNWNYLGSFLNPFRQQFHLWLAQHQFTIDNPLSIAYLKQTLQQQAYMLGFINAYTATIGIYLILFPLLLVFKPSKKTK
ncbi:MAG: Fatty acid resistance protein FarB [Legionellaceae bacterium]